MRLRSLLLAVLVLISFPVHSSAQGIIYSSNVNAGKRIALSFDDGPHPKLTEKILDILDQYGIKATFFVIGVNAKNYPDSLREISKRGHEIGNHTYSHNILKSMPADKIEREISDTENQVFDILGIRPNLLRPPCGLYDESLVKIANDKSLKIVLWAVDTHDWAHNSTMNIVNHVLKKSKDGDIILFHDYVSGEYNTPEALKKLIPGLLKQGYEFVTVSELLQNT